MTVLAASSLKIPSVEKYDFPSGKLDPKSKELVLIGKRVSLLRNIDEHKNVAIASLATAAIFLVGGIILSYMANPVLGSLMISTAVVLGTAGSLFFVIKKYLDPKLKIESDKDELRFALFQKLLRYDSENLEGFDLLEKAILDRSSNPEDKEKVYICVRQLKRQLEKINEQKKQHEEGIESQYNKAVERLEAIRDLKIRNILPTSVDGERTFQIAQIQRDFQKEMTQFKEWKKRAIEVLDKQYKEAVNGLDLQYDILLKNLGKPEKKEPEAQSRMGFVWGKLPWAKKA